MEFNETLIAENEYFKIYTNFVTETSDVFAKRLGDDYRVVKIHNLMDGRKEFALIHDGSVIYSHTCIFDVDAHIEMLYIANKV